MSCEKRLDKTAIQQVGNISARLSFLSLEVPESYYLDPEGMSKSTLIL